LKDSILGKNWFKIVRKKHSEGLICLSACLAGRLPRLLLDDLVPDKYEKAVEYALKLKSIFDEGDFLHRAARS